MELTPIQKEKYEKVYRQIIIFGSIIIVLANLLGAYLIREEVRESNIRSIQEYGVDGEGQEFYRNIDKRLAIDPYMVYFLNIFKFTSFTSFIIILIKIHPKHWLSYLLLVVGVILLFSIILSSAGSGFIEFDSFAYYLNRVLLYLSIPFFIWSLHNLAIIGGKMEAEHLKNIASAS